MSPKKPLQQLKTGALSRGFAMAKMGFAMGTRAATQAFGEILSGQEADPADPTQRMRKLIEPHVGMITEELGRLKGSLMKAGQMLSMYGEHFLPPEANAILKKLQNQSQPVEWKEMEKVLKRQLGKQKLELLEIDPEPLAAASLGQVHLARVKSSGRTLALKIQYPGVEDAIEGDLKALRTLFNMAKLIPKGPSFDPIFDEIRRMLRQEVDYRRELKATQHFVQALEGDPRYVVPRPIEEFSSGRVLATSFEEGFAVDSAEVAALSQERRNAIGKAMLELYFREIFELGVVQTDPHFGNYRIRLGKDGAPDQLVILDFGAVRELDEEFLEVYREVIRACFSRDPERLERAAERIGFLREGDSPELRKNFLDLCFLITEPFAPENQPYPWGETHLPQRVTNAGKKMAFRSGGGVAIRLPPREIVFLDRKMGGIFIFLSVLKVKIQAREVLERFVISSIE